MTNGEKIQKDFKGCEVCEPIVEDDIIHVIFADKKDSAIGFDWSWWNAEYKEPTTKNDLVVNTDKLISDCEKMSFDIEFFNKPLKVVALDAVKNIVNDLPPVTPQKPRRDKLDTIKQILEDSDLDAEGTLEIIKEVVEE